MFRWQNVRLKRCKLPMVRAPSFTNNAIRTSRKRAKSVVNRRTLNRLLPPLPLLLAVVAIGRVAVRLTKSGVSRRLVVVVPRLATAPLSPLLPTNNNSNRDQTALVAVLTAGASNRHSSSRALRYQEAKSRSAFTLSTTPSTQISDATSVTKLAIAFPTACLLHSTSTPAMLPNLISNRA